MRRAPKQAREPDDADKAERLMRNLARRFGQEAPDVSGSILEGFDEILTVVGLGLPLELRRSLAGTNIIASMNGSIRQARNGSIRQVRRDVKRWRDAKMALRWPAAGMFEAGKGFRPHHGLQAVPHSQSGSQVLITVSKNSRVGRSSNAPREFTANFGLDRD